MIAAVITHLFVVLTAALAPAFSEVRARRSTTLPAPLGHAALRDRRRPRAVRQILDRSQIASMVHGREERLAARRAGCAA